jgi:hypothetical protein
LGTAAIVPDVMSHSDVGGARRCSGSVPMHVAVPSNGSWSGRGAGENGPPHQHEDRSR